MLPKPLKTPDNMMSGRDTSEGSFALIGRTPEFLSALNDASAVMEVDTQPIPTFQDDKNQDLKGVFSKPALAEEA